MGNSVSTLSSRKASTGSLDSGGKKPSLFQRSKSSLQFRKRSKSSLSSDSSNCASNNTFGRNKGNQVVPNRHLSMDSSDDHSDLSQNSQSGDSSSSNPAVKHIPRHLQDNSTNNSNLTTGVPGGSLPEWAHHSRRCDDGRTRHTVESAPYMLPNDLTESDRLDAQHYLVRFIFKGNYNVKLDQDANLKILDVATGTGVWALEMAHEFPKAGIYGVDISSIFPAEIKPKNCHFQLYTSQAGAGNQQTNQHRLLRVLKPEGFLQLVESDGIVYNAGPEMEKINQLSLETSLRHGVDPREVQTMKTGLKQAGYTGANSFNIALPVGDWGGKAGALSRQNMHGLATIWLKGEVGKLDQDSCDKVLAKVDQEIEQFQSYYKVWLVVGMKPSVAQTQLKEAKKAAAALAASNTAGASPPADDEPLAEAV
ncbi:hypothetical protein KVV02_004752 [Mortierella alpina]|uniref:Methyltransferase domain-containing protein n=1 Tax=Mortierella alpina TaxID=64518 RepID=A0A9P8AAM0_MORAP|nr:hypothetical protein KVV02_004752 [Mortierella alpina]